MNALTQKQQYFVNAISQDVKAIDVFTRIKNVSPRFLEDKLSFCGRSLGRLLILASEYLTDEEYLQVLAYKDIDMSEKEAHVYRYQFIMHVLHKIGEGNK